jgi:hypothetical protein
MKPTMTTQCAWCLCIEGVNLVALARYGLSHCCCRACALWHFGRKP